MVLRFTTHHGECENLPEIFAPEKTIFQTWKTRVDLPSWFQVWSDSWRNLHPRFAHILWDDGDNLRFVEASFPALVPLYKMFDREIFRVDLVRYLYLFANGGIYADMDFECLQPFDGYFDRSSAEDRPEPAVVLGRMGEGSSYSEHRVTNALMVARCRRHVLWVVVLALVAETMRNHTGGVLYPDCVTGPVVLFRALRVLADHPTAGALEGHPVVGPMFKLITGGAPVATGSVHIEPPGRWYPFDWTTQEGQEMRRRVVFGHHLFSESEKKALFPDAMAVTYFTTTWGNW